MRAVVTLLGVITAASPALAAEGGAGELFFPLLNFALLLAVLVYFGRRPIMGFFNDRRLRIQEDLEAAAEQKRQAEERYAGWQRKLAHLEEEIAAIREASRDRAASEREHILADARASAERIRADATAAIEQELRRSRSVLREEAASLAIELAENLLRVQVSDADRERLVSEFIARVEASGAAAGPGVGR
jgi:F-type H+-transporting ATPase subunit b